MITLGLDPHPASHTVVALDHNGSSLGSAEVPNTEAGLEELRRFALRHPVRRWAIEVTSNHFISRFVTRLLADREVVYPIAPSLTSQYRSRRGRKKIDEVDAANVARALLANPQLPTLQASDHQRALQSCHVHKDAFPSNSSQTVRLSLS